MPFYFNLSHSGDYVLCAVSSAEIGTDIQQHCGKNVERLARRFFTEREAAALEQAGEERETRERLFYRLWARKEAYGKLTGKGIAAALEVDFLPGGTVSSPYGCSSGEVGGKRLLWEEYDSIAGYSIALCRYG
ncbi:MAG: 4'-phosphopantetheinyl transferase superfamily protein [Lachnospiraceae bacterium]|uniref:4'-phosphopantetheinyl transferase family protein n=1 Tax=uncultured Acetatifactor sp. TaxID=1671927 RepID=UPI0026134027|nr:4'-phosphopantetheinyl transferase superfamily protein [uncultured Acetatifactor sp.]MCI8696980.1 4'-phosphopantetheinyl transferase superfamily protein [Lachnospiraceae bacterium]MCI9573932.1 4'-phosphopantetheinyl transferase superfamily protein [Lachnospiraceae bacterium]MCI9651756.1 4'-phosphopantetheinyl transferase superfamily protein [Lachnospiraceae bacterium]